MVENQYHIIDTIEKLNKLKEYLTTYNFTHIAVDTETNGLSRDRLLMGISLSVTANEGFYIAIREGKDCTPIIEDKKTIIEILNSCNKHIYHNAVFDFWTLKHNLGYDNRDKIYFDTMLASHLINENYRGAYGLDACARREINPEFGKDIDKLKEEVKNLGGEWKAKQKDMYYASKETLGFYASRDTDLTLQLYPIYLGKLKAWNLVNFFLKDETMPICKVVCGMYEEGVPIDIEYYKDLSAKLGPEILKLEKDTIDCLKTLHSEPYKALVRSVLDKKVPRVASGKFIAATAKYENLDLEYSKKGTVTWAKKALEKLADKYPDSLTIKWKKGEITQDDKEEYNKFLEMIDSVQRGIYFKEDSVKKTGQKYVLNLMSNDNTAKLLFDYMGEEPIKCSKKTGKPQVDIDVLSKFKDKYSFITTLVKYRQARKLKETYIDSFIEKSIKGSDGIYRIYPSFLVHGTTSGRFSGNSPNFQNLSARKNNFETGTIEEDSRVRYGICAPEGYNLISADYSQFEVRIFAHVSNELKLINSVIKGEDYYGRIAVDLYDLICEPNEVKKLYPEKRTITKTLGLGIPYGAKKWKVGTILGSDEKEGQIFLDNYWSTYKQLKKFVTGTHNQALNNGWVKNEFGRIRHLSECKKLKYKKNREDVRLLNHKLNNAVNYKIQSMAASIINRAKIKINEQFGIEGLSSKIIIQVHDEIIVIAKKEECDRTAQIMKEIMENIYKLKVPLIAEPVIHKRMSGLK